MVVAVVVVVGAVALVVIVALKNGICQDGGGDGDADGNGVGSCDIKNDVSGNGGGRINNDRSDWKFSTVI